MNAAKQAAWLFTVLLSLAFSSLYFASLNPIKRLDASVLSKTADMVVTNLQVMRFDETGKLINRLQTTEVQHIPENNTHLLQLPRLALTQEKQPAWQISSKQAKAIHNGEQITFIHDVVVHQDKNKQGQESTIKTELLDYFSKSKIASTEAPVRFEQPGTVVNSRGMKVDFEKKRVQLSQARATLVPKHEPKHV